MSELDEKLLEDATAQIAFLLEHKNNLIGQLDYVESEINRALLKATRTGFNEIVLSKISANRFKLEEYIREKTLKTIYLDECETYLQKKQEK